MEQPAISSDLIRGHIDTIILHTLLDEDKFAQQISDAIEQKSDGEYKINQATLYSSLKRLEGLKYVKSYWNDSVGGRRKYFKLTETGKITVETNLSSWSFSRAIIDKLMDCEPQSVYKTQYIEKIVEVEKEIFVQKPPISDDNTKNESENKAITTENITHNVENKVRETAENKQEINFRSILNGLIKTTTIKKQEPNTELEPLEKLDLQEKSVEKQKLNETLRATDYNAQKSNNNGKIDFGDLTLKAAKEGYKIRISSKDSAISEGTLLINKVNMLSTVIMFLVIAIQFLYFGLRYGELLKLNFPITASIIILFALYPIFCLIKFFKNPKKTVSKVVSSDIILTSAIVVFNLLLITFAANLLGNVNFSDKFTILLSLIIPFVLYVDIFLFFIIKFTFSKSKICVVKNKK